MHNIWSNGINIGEIYTKLKSYTSLQTVIFIILLFLIKAALISGSNKKNLYNIAKSLSRWFRCNTNCRFSKGGGGHLELCFHPCTIKKVVQIYEIGFAVTLVVGSRGGIWHAALQSLVQLGSLTTEIKLANLYICYDSYCLQTT